MKKSYFSFKIVPKIISILGLSGSQEKIGIFEKSQ